MVKRRRSKGWRVNTFLPKRKNIAVLVLLPVGGEIRKNMKEIDKEIKLEVSLGAKVAYQHRKQNITLKMK